MNKSKRFLIESAKIYQYLPGWQKPVTRAPGNSCKKAHGSHGPSGFKCIYAENPSPGEPF